MSFDGIRTARQTIETLLGDPCEAHRAAVAAEHGVTLEPIAAIIRSKQVEYQYPHAEVAPVQGPVQVNGDTIYGAYQRWVMIADRDADPAQLALRMEAWLTVLMRTFAAVGGADGSWDLTITEVDEAPPVAKDETWVAVCGVKVVVTQGSDV